MEGLLRNIAASSLERIIAFLRVERLPYPSAPRERRDIVMLPDVGEVVLSLRVRLEPRSSEPLTTPSPRIGTSLLQQVAPQPLHSHPPRQAEVEGLGHLPHLPPLRVRQGLGIRDT